MKAIVLAAKKQFPNSPGIRPSLKLFRQIGDLAFEQLSSLRHRGALGTVSLTFAACCQVASTIEGPCEGSDSLLSRWYEVSRRFRFAIAPWLQAPAHHAPTDPNLGSAALRLDPGIDDEAVRWHPRYHHRHSLRQRVHALV